MKKTELDLNGFADICNETELILTKGGMVPYTENNDTPCGSPSGTNNPISSTEPPTPPFLNESGNGGK